MRIVFGLVLIIGVALAGFAVHMTRGYLATYQDREQSLRAQAVDTAEIYVAAVRIAYGQPITPEMVKKVKWPVEAVPEQPFFAEEQLFPDGPDVQRVARRTMEPMEPLMGIKVSLPGETAGVAFRLSKGMRAFAIRVDVSSGVSGLLRPGDRVDVYWTGRLPGSASEVTRLLLPAMSLIAVDQSSDADRQSSTIARTVTVEATPTQVAGLATAQSSGRLSLALVGRGDDTVVDAVQVDQETLFGIVQQEEEVILTPQAPRVCTIRTRKGGEIIDTPIPCSD
ncbi:Flp pilus assembly protein CpaB [Celeribacter litoreus]|uniref:Flp pilus assembly protein CpaB n=1 Tax=Celeribacter litoreus TaxID=2876714 RepID=UPI001CC9372C|nr:Flp pilus assembly protein CpaB [Celeribacter litoreus]MCA0044050.1 Flp pilus assembly protein CpaB [Celeribacter litoreus]